MSTTLTFSSPLWRYSPDKGSWFFVTLPRDDADFVKWIEDKKVVGFGFVRVRATVGGSTWETTLFPDTRHGYILAINAKVRKKENLREGDAVEVKIYLL